MYTVTVQDVQRTKPCTPAPVERFQALWPDGLTSDSLVGLVGLARHNGFAWTELQWFLEGADLPWLTDALINEYGALSCIAPTLVWVSNIIDTRTVCNIWL